MPGESAATAPRMFLSYSWSSPDHEAWVLALANKLMADGVEVILDKWSLTPGQDGNVFMERMVTDPAVSKVLMICDRIYVDKADGRRGGVGTEAQIISPQLYRDHSADQTKFAAACLTLDEGGQPLVPVFYKGRIHFDFTRDVGFDVAYEQVLRWAHGRPQHVAPPLGRMPPSLAVAPGLSLALASTVPPSRLAIERVEAFRTERLAEITAGRTPTTISPGAIAVLHMVPMPMLENDDAVDIVAMVSQGTEMPVPLAGQGGRVSFTVDGVCNALGVGGYGQLLRSGAYECVHVLSVSEDHPYVASTAFANMVVGAVRRGLRLQAHYDFPFPTAVLLSLASAAGVTMRLPTEFGASYYETRALGRPVVAFPRVILGRAELDAPPAVRPLLNALWNAFGQAGCTMYDGQGHWTGVA